MGDVTAKYTRKELQKLQEEGKAQPGFLEVFYWPACQHLLAMTPHFILEPTIIIIIPCDILVELLAGSDVMEIWI